MDRDISTGDTGKYSLIFEEADGLSYFISRPLLDEHNILVVFTTRRGGVSPDPYASLNLAFHVGDNPDKVVKNRDLVCRRLGLDATRMVCAEQVHGAEAAVVGELEAGRGAMCLQDSIPGVDALITADQSIPLTLFFADCVPVILVEPNKRVISVVHAGWRGMYGEVIGASVRTMVSAYGVHPGNLIAFIGPAIGGCCYRVGADVAEKFSHKFTDVAGWLDGATLNLRELGKMQLVGNDIPPGNVYQCDGCCSSCRNDLFFSYRADGGTTGRQAAITAILPDTNKDTNK
ncbi:MAG: peptidoglycan editing factor PgeF [Candidatus Aquicultor sp.]